MSVPVVLDARMADHPGIGRYIRQLAAAMLTQKNAPPFVFLGDEGAFSLPPFGADVQWRQAHSPIYSLAEQIEIPRLAGKKALLHVPHFNVPVFFRGRLVVTIHDLIYLHSPRVSKFFFAGAYARALFRHVEKSASAVITVSEYTKTDLLRHFPKIKPERVFVTHEAASGRFFKIKDEKLLIETKEKYGLHKPFALFVGTLKAHKNLPVLVEAMARLNQKPGADHDLVLVGRADPQNRLLSEAMSRHGNFIKSLGPLSDDDLPALYNLADTLVLPSLFEGFGLPVLEAMACGTPVIASTGGSLPEVVGEAGLLFEPERIDALVEHLYNVFQKKDLREKLSVLGLQRAAQFSWEKTARETLAVYQACS